jgi:ribosome modulation factor
MADRVTTASGASNVNDDTILLHSRQIRTAWDAKNDASAAFLKACKKADDDGVNVKELTKVLKVKQGDPAKADINLRDNIRYRKLLDVPVKWDIDGQGSFEIPTNVSPAAQREQNDFDDFADGEKAGLDGHSATTCPHEPGTERYQTWMLGWEKGQKINLEGGNRPPEAAAPAKAGRGKGKTSLRSVN